MHNVRTQQQSWRRVLGLSSRALSVTAQRVLDVMAIYKSFRAVDAPDGTVLVVGLVITTALMAFTMRKHWSSLRGHRPYGTTVALVSSVLQVASMVEMLDKMCSQGRPRFGDLRGVQRDSLTEPLLRSAAPKGSPGENSMRGVRKLSMVNLPQAFLSLWFHIGQLLPQSGDLTEPHRPWVMVAAFVAGFFAMGFGIADFVLYVWVDDAFVRQNKKLVTLHYCIEILARLPTLVLFHVTYRQMCGYLPMLSLCAIDIITTSFLLQMPRFTGLWQRRSCLAGGSRHSIMQCLFSLGVAIPLFFVNIVIFDPGMMFFYVNHWAFYLVKWCEFVLMWYLIPRARVTTHVKPDIYWGVAVLKLPRRWYDFFMVIASVFVLLNAWMVMFCLPGRRRESQKRFTNFATAEDTRDTWRPDGPARSNEDLPSSAVASRQASGSTDESHSGRSPTLLENLEEIFELLLILSKVTCRRNRSRLLSLIVNELWRTALPWNGTFMSSDGRSILMYVDPQEHIVTFTSSDGLAPVQGFPAHNGSLVCGVLVIPNGPRGELRGHFDGKRIVWEDGQVWTRQADNFSKAFKSANTVLKSILPQLALALRWDAPPAPRGEESSRRLDSDGNGASGAIAAGFLLPSPGSPGRSEGSDLEAGEPDIADGNRPLLSFLIRYGLATRQADFLSDLYWALVCLSHDEGQSGNASFAYTSAREALLAALRGDSSSLAGLPRDEELSDFLRTVRRLLRGQQEVWRQNLDLIMQHSGRSIGGGSWSLKTEALRNALRRWPELRRSRRPSSEKSTSILCSDGQLLASASGTANLELCGAGPSETSETPPLINLDMVSPVQEEDTLISLPIDPMIQFRGIVIEESEVIPSKQAPLMLTCKMARARSRLISSPHQSPRSDKTGSSFSNEEMKEKYLIKVGDDLRQDQLMLQMMALMSCVWQETLPAKDARLLQIANFRVLAVTPQSGYVKFVAESMCLTDAMHESRGDLVAWLKQNKLESLSFDEVMDNFCGSVAASCVVTYVLGIGDRHLENLCITRRGQFFNIDFGFILGDDPKPMAPPVRLPQQVAQALLATDRLAQCFALARQAYLALRPLAGLWSSMLQLTAATGGAGVAKLAREPLAAVSGVLERLRVGPLHDQEDAERAAEEFLCLMRESSEALASIVIDKVHAAGLFWR